MFAYLEIAIVFSEALYPAQKGSKHSWREGQQHQSFLVAMGQYPTAQLNAVAAMTCHWFHSLLAIKLAKPIPHTLS
jgi:hypothetical protein